MSDVERTSFKPEITRISGHAIENVMTRWGMSLVEAQEFVRDRYGSAEEIEQHLTKKKAHRNKRVFKSGDATFIGTINNNGLVISTVIRTDRLDRRMMGTGLLRRKV